jgi:hypothetical protein
MKHVKILDIFEYKTNGFASYINVFNRFVYKRAGSAFSVFGLVFFRKD